MPSLTTFFFNENGIRPGEVYRLQSKVALVTGGSRGLGRAIAKSLSSEGAKVVVNIFLVLPNLLVSSLTLAVDIPKPSVVPHLVSDRSVTS